MDHETLKKNEVKYLDWDSKFFGFSIGRMHANGLTEELLRKGLENARKEKMNFVELFCDASDSESIFAAEVSNFHLADVRLTFKKNLAGDVNDDIARKGIFFKKADIEDINRVKIVSYGIFSSSRYYNYPKFDKNKVNLLFQIWIEKAIKGEFDDELYYLCDETDILAFISHRYRENAVSIGLFGINKTYWGKGFGSMLLKHASHLFRKRHVTEVNVVTQGRNSSALHLYQKNGFYLSKITMCFFKWMEFKGCEKNGQGC